MIDQYFQTLNTLIHNSDIVNHVSVTFDERTTYIGYVRGILYLIDGSELYFREYVDVKDGIERYTYSYHHQ